MGSFHRGKDKELYKKRPTFAVSNKDSRPLRDRSYSGGALNFPLNTFPHIHSHLEPFFTEMIYEYKILLQRSASPIPYFSLLNRLAFPKHRREENGRYRDGSLR